MEKKVPLVRGADRAAHEEVGARQAEAQGAEMASTCYGIALLLADMETIRAGASPSPKDRNLKLEFVEPGSEAVTLRQGAEGASSCRCI